MISIRANKNLRWGLLLLLLVAAVIAILSGFTGRAQRASASETTVVCTTNVNNTFNLRATDGYITSPDGNTLYMWGFADDDGTLGFQYPGPTLCVNEGDTVTVNLTNDLAEPVSIIFPGQTGVDSSGGAPGLFTAEAAAGGGTVSYTFTATNPGTYLYESGTNTHKQVQMGLFGALIVRPSMGSNYAYNDASSEFDPLYEYLLLIHEIDPNLHLAVERGEPYNVTQLWDRYWTINGRSFPDDIAPNFVPWLPNQPYGALVQVEADNPLPALVRYANAGMFNHPFHPHGNNLNIIARDGRLLDGPIESFTTNVGAGQTYDLLAKWENVDQFDPTSNPLPVEVPGLYNLVIKDDVTFYSGQPYLTDGKGDFLVGVTSYNECGEFYFPWHSHALNEFQNFDEGFGGLATLWRVDPPGGCQ